MSCKCKQHNKDKKRVFNKDDKTKLLFKDKIFTSKLKFLDEEGSEKRTLVSIRDGYQDYLGDELGIEPRDKIFKVYRSAETIKELTEKLVGVPLLERHIPPAGEIPQSLIVGKILTSEVIPNDKGENDSTIAIENEITLFKDKLQFDNEQLSLGYKATTTRCPSGRYDFIQSEIVPHHLAIVEAGRCGDICEFKDENTIERKEMGIDEIIEAITQLLQNGSDEDKAKLKALFLTDEEADEEKKETVDEEAEEEKKTTDEEAEEEEKKYEDRKIANKAVKNFIDSNDFEKLINRKVNEKTDVIEKAKNFLDSGYDFRSKTALQIQKDALKAEKRGQSFLDSEVPLAFKLLEVDKYDNGAVISVIDSAKNSEDEKFIKEFMKGY